MTSTHPAIRHWPGLISSMVCVNVNNKKMKNIFLRCLLRNQQKEIVWITYSYHVNPSTQLVIMIIISEFTIYLKEIDCFRLVF